jgi:hypothetical protein
VISDFFYIGLDLPGADGRPRQRKNDEVPMRRHLSLFQFLPIFAPQLCQVWFKKEIEEILRIV